MEVDALLVPTEVVAHEVYAQLSTPLLWRFLREMPAQRRRLGGRRSIDRLTALCGTPPAGAVEGAAHAAGGAGAGAGWLASGGRGSGDLLRNPEDRDEPLHAVPLLVLRGDEAHPRARTATSSLAAGDELLLAGRPGARRALDTTLLVDAVARVRPVRPAGAVELDLAPAEPDSGSEPLIRPGHPWVSLGSPPMATLHLQRRLDGGGILRRLLVQVDGHEVAGLRQGQFVRIPLARGTHSVVGRLDWTSSPALDVDVAADEEVRIEVALPFSALWNMLLRPRTALAIRRL